MHLGLFVLTYLGALAVGGMLTVGMLMFAAPF